MPYNYQTERPELFTENGSTMLRKMRNNTFALLKQSGAVRMQEMMRGVTGDGWLMLACADYMVEIGDLVEVTGSDAA